MNEASGTTDTLLRLARIASALVFFGGLSVMLYLDREYNVTSAFPLKHHRTPPPIAFLLLGTVCFPLGGSVLIGALADLLRAALSEGWPTVRGKVLKSEVEMRLGKGPKFDADVRYEYEVDGRRYSGSKVQFAQGNYRFSADAANVTDRYPVGAEVEVRYNPGNPAEAALESSPASAQQTIWFSATFLAMPFLSFYPPFLDMLNG